MNRRTALKTAAGFLAGLLVPFRKSPAKDPGHTLWVGLAESRSTLRHSLVGIWTPETGWVDADQIRQR